MAEDAARSQRVVVTRATCGVSRGPPGVGRAFTTLDFRSAVAGAFAVVAVAGAIVAAVTAMTPTLAAAGELLQARNH